MLLKVQQTAPNNGFPTVQLAILAICRLAEPIALASILPYAYSMVQSFQFGDPQQAATYAGILVSSFSIAEASVCVFWGMLSDRIGRKPVLLMGCAGTMLSMLMMGFASNFWFALVARCLGGLLNGNIGVIQTMVGEICKNPDHQPRAYAVMPIVWLIGTVVGPAIAAFTIGVGFEGLPYLLPNLICAVLLALSMVIGYFFLQETHPDFVQTRDDDIASIIAPAELHVESYGTFSRIDGTDALEAIADETSPLVCVQPSSQETKTFTRRVLMLIVCLGIFCYHSMTYDHLLPIFLQDPSAPSSPEEISAAGTGGGGLGFSTHQVGLLLSVNGVIALVVQIFVFPMAASFFGVFRLFQITLVGQPLIYLAAPCIAFLPDSLIWVGLYGELVLRNLLTITIYPLILILIKEASLKPSGLGKINGLAASVGSFTRAIAPPVAGMLYSLGRQQGVPGLAWYGSAFVALLGAGQIFWVKRQKTAVIEDAVEEGWDGKKHEMRVEVTEVDSD